MKKWKTALAVAAGLLFVLSCAQLGLCQEKQVVRVSGALPLSDVVNGWATDFMKINPNAQITVLGKTAGYGYEQFLEGQADLVMATRKMTEDEQKKAAAKGIKPGERLVMNIGVAFITSAKNPVSFVTVDQLRNIYAGGISNWKEVGGLDQPIKVLQRPYPATGVAVLFKEQILKDLDYRKDAIVLSSYKNMVQICEQSPAIGHIPSTAVFCDPAKYKIKILAVKKDADSPAVMPGHPEYPVNMMFMFVWNPASVSKMAESFVQFSVDKAKDYKRH